MLVEAKNLRNGGQVNKPNRIACSDDIVMCTDSFADGATS
jgi:hypothetical protein